LVELIERSFGPADFDRGIDVRLQRLGKLRKDLVSYAEELGFADPLGARLDVPLDALVRHGDAIAHDVARFDNVSEDADECPEDEGGQQGQL